MPFLLKKHGASHTDMVYYTAIVTYPYSLKVMWSPMHRWCGTLVRAYCVLPLWHRSIAWDELLQYTPSIVVYLDDQSTLTHHHHHHHTLRMYGT